MQIDTTDYSEISRVDVDGRCVLDLASDPLDSSLALITADADGGSTSTRIYDIGRQRSEVNRRPQRLIPTCRCRPPCIHPGRIVAVGKLGVHAFLRSLLQAPHADRRVLFRGGRVMSQTTRRERVRMAEGQRTTTLTTPMRSQIPKRLPY